MSGFEAIGLTLIVWPLVVNALDLYKSAPKKNGEKNGDGVWTELLSDLRTEETIYREFVDRLLAAHLTEDARLEYESDSSAMWALASLHRRLQRGLGPNADIVLHTIPDMERLLRELNAKVNDALKFSGSTVRKFWIVIKN
jgi:hypothetical protein